jgi:hypothetical protein
MCKVVYFVADRRLPDVVSPKSRVGVQGMDPLPTFSVRAFDGPERERVCAIAGGGYVHIASSWQGCGCGFGYESSHEFDASLEGAPADVRATAAEAREARKASVASLADYLEQVVCDGPVTVYVAYAGGEGRRPLVREQQVLPSHFGGDSFWFQEDELYDVTGTT